MELRHLRYFIAVAEHENVRIAAERVHITQPAMSRQIQDLEAELQVSLFHRGARGLKLTAAGEVFLRGAVAVLEQVDASSRLARLVAAGLNGQLSIGFTENAGWSGIIPDTFGEFQRSTPDVRLELTPSYTLDQQQKIRGGALDGGFVYQFEALPPDFDGIALMEHRIVLAVPTSWGYAAGVPVPARSLARRPFVMCTRAVYPAYYDRVLAACQAAGITLDIRQEAASETSILSLVAAGIGAALVNSANAGRPTPQIQYLELADLALPLPLMFIHLRDNANPSLPHFLMALARMRRAAEAGVAMPCAGAAQPAPPGPTPAAFGNPGKTSSRSS